MKKIKDILTRRIEDYRDESEVYINNEIATNVLMGKVVAGMIGIAILNLILIVCGVFDASMINDFASYIAILILQTAIVIANIKTKGHLLYVRYGLICGVIIAMCYFVSVYASEITIIVALPMFIAVKYYDYKFTKKVVIITIVMAAIGMYLYYFTGGVNLNIFYLEEPGIIFDANVPIVVLGVDKEVYIYRLLIYDYLFDFLVLFLLGYIACFLTKHGRKMIEEESDNIEKSARIETELGLATEIQADMLPCTYPAFPNHQDIDLFAVNYPAREMGGDFYDYLQIDDDHVAIIMADVSGKGIGAAFFMSIAKSSLDFTLSEYNVFSPADHLTRNNHYLYLNNKAGLFVTCWLGIYEISTHKLTYANAGHNSPVIIRKGQQPEYLKGKTGLVLAGMDDTQYKDNVIELNKGDEIILYTDGVTEANDASKNLFGEQRLLKEIDKVKELSCLDQVNAIIASLQEYMKDTEQFDDITLLSMKIK